jgi:D-alanine-D-alanine ligase
MTIARQPTRKKTVAVLVGGPSTEHQISLLSSIQLLQALDRNQYDLLLIGIDQQGAWWRCHEADYLRHPEDPARIQLRVAGEPLALRPGSRGGQLLESQSGTPLPTIDVVFPLLHGSLGEDGALQGLLRWLKLPFVGCDLLSSAIGMDKAITKQLLQAAGIPVAPYVVLRHPDVAQIDSAALVATLGLPLFVKPASQGSSIGVSQVLHPTELQPAVQRALVFDHTVLIETAIKGQEIECALLGDQQPEASVCGEIVMQDSFYAYETKYLNSGYSQLVIPAPLMPETSERVRLLAIQAWQLLGCCGMARVDFFVTPDQQIFLNEINTIPGFTAISMYPQLWAASGLPYPQLVDRLITLALEHAQTSVAWPSGDQSHD